VRAFSLLAALFFGLGLALGPVSAADFDVPELTGPVVDAAGVLSPATKRVVSEALRALHERGGSQITVLTVRSLEGVPIEQASIRVVDQWRLGGKKLDNGVLLLIAPKERKLRIEVGQGLEGALTDADSNRIIFQSMVPLLKSGDLNSAVIVGVYQIARKTDPNFDLSPYLEGHVKDRRPVSDGGTPLRFWLILAAILFLLFIGRGRHSGFHRGGWGGGGWGGGGFGGGAGSGRGGGWSGGGGGFSGGGASGDW